MFLDLDGNVIDYFNGSEDLSNKMIRFVGNPSERIREDYLRIFRYFRFYVRYGCHTKHDPCTLDAIKENKDGLKGISGERIWAELKKILSYEKCDSIMAIMMNDLGISPFMGFLTKTIDLKEFTRTHASLFSDGPKATFEPVTLLSSMLSSEEEHMKVTQRLKLSNFERDVAFFILSNRDSASSVTLDSLKRSLALTHKSEQRVKLLLILQFLRYINSYDLLKEIESWTIPEFPLRGDALKHKVKKPKNMTPLMNHLKQVWAENNFQLNPDTIDKIADEFLDKFLNK